MASTKLFSLVEMTVSGAPGTGNIVLGGARANNRLTFSEAGVSNGDVVSYVVEDAGNIEYGIGTYTSATNTLSRDTVRASKIAGVSGTTKLPLTDGAIVWIDAASNDLDVSDFTEDTTPAPSADFMWMHDTSAGYKKKVKPSNLATQLGAALTKVDDTNVTLTLAGSPNTALLQATSVTVSWTGTLAAGRLNSNVVQGVTNDTNVTGSIATQNLTLGWTGQLGIARGGTGQATASAAFDALSPTTTRGDIIYRNATTNARLAAGTSGYHLQASGAGADPSWSGFLSTLTNATTRTWNAKAADIVSVKDFGATGNGSTDDTTSIQNCITSVGGAGGGIVFFPTGTYKVSSALSISSTGVALRGESNLSSTIRSTSTTADIISITNGYWTVDNLILQGPLASRSTAGNAINASGASNGRATNLYISDCFNGILLNNSSSCLVQHCKLFNLYGNYGIESANLGGNYIINNQVDPVFYGHGSYTWTNGFAAWQATHAYVAGDVVSNNGYWWSCSTGGTSAGSGGPQATVFNTAVTDGTVTWYMLGATSLALIELLTDNSNFVAFNDCSGPASNGILITTTSGGNIIQGNTVGQIIGSGIQIGTSSTGNVIKNNLISGVYGSTAIGISDATSNTATNTQIIGNTVNNSGWYGIFCASSRWNIQANMVLGAGQITAAYGIEVAANVTKFAISNNAIPNDGIMAGAIRVNSGSSDYYTIAGNLTEGGTITDSGTGTHKVILTESGLKGTVTNDSAGSGYTGEIISSAIESGSATALTTATGKNVTSISLTAGDWEVTGIVHLSGGATTTFTNGFASISSTSATLNNTAANCVQMWGNGNTIVSSATYVSFPAITTRVSLSATTTYYLVTLCAFGTSTLSAFGYLQARRLR